MKFIDRKTEYIEGWYILHTDTANHTHDSVAQTDYWIHHLTVNSAQILTSQLGPSIEFNYMTSVNIFCVSHYLCCQNIVWMAEYLDLEFCILYIDFIRMLYREANKNK